MSDTVTLEQVAELAAQLPPAERKQLAEKLLAELAAAAAPAKKYSFADIRGTMPYPMLGEDAQTVISRERREGDEHREKQLRRTGE